MYVGMISSRVHMYMDGGAGDQRLHFSIIPCVSSHLVLEAGPLISLGPLQLD